LIVNGFINGTYSEPPVFDMVSWEMIYHKTGGS